jgi:hypothetical protein
MVFRKRVGRRQGAADGLCDLPASERLPSVPSLLRSANRASNVSTCSGSFSEDGDVIRSRWEKSNDGVSWELDFDLTYRRVKGPKSG